MADSDSASTVLLVDDEPSLIELYELTLAERHEVLTATAADEALDRFDGSVDVVVLDRRMPETSGDELVELLRERGHDVPVAMVSAVRPAADIVELPIDDYLTKPVGPEDLRRAVESLAVRAALDREHRELFALVSKRSAIEAQDRGTDDPDAVRELVARIEAIGERLAIDDPALVDASGPDELPRSVRDACHSP